MNMYPLSNQMQETCRNNVQNESSTGPNNQHAIMRTTVEANQTDSTLETINKVENTRSHRLTETVEPVGEQRPAVNIRDRTKHNSFCRRVWF